MWDIRTGAVLKRLAGHQNWITSVDLSPDGRLALSGSQDHSAILWDVESGTISALMAGHETWVTAVAISSDSRYAATGSRDGIIRLWDLNTGGMLFDSRAACEADSAICAGSISELAFVQDAAYLLAARANGHIELWSVDSRRLIRQIGGDRADLTSMSLNSEGKLLATGTSSGAINVWQIDPTNLINWIRRNRYVQCPQDDDTSIYQLSQEYQPDCDMLEGATQG